MSKKNLNIDGAMDTIKEISNVVDNVEAKANFNLIQIPLDKIINNPKNKFGMRNIEELADSMKEFGQMHNAVVRIMHDGEFPYRLISGERRWRAAQLLGWETLTCKAIECDDIQDEILTIITNIETRELNELEKSVNIQRLGELVAERRKKGEDFGGKKTREIIAEELKMKPAQVQKYISVNKLIEEFKTMLADGQIGIEEANHYAQMSEETQKFVFNEIDKGAKHSAKLAKEFKEQEKVKDEQLKKLQNDLADKDKEILTAKEDTEEVNRKLKEIESKNKDLEDKWKTANSEIDNYKNLLKAKEIEADNIKTNLKKQIEEELKNKNSNADEDSPRVIELKGKLKQAEENSDKIKAEMHKKLEDEQLKLKDIEKEKKAIQSELDVTKKQTKEKIINENNIEFNAELVSLAKQAKIALSILIGKVSEFKTKEGFKLNDETKKIISEVSQFDPNLK